MKNASYISDGDAINHFNESFTYDKQGNIKTLKRNVYDSHSSLALMDDLVMTYSGNQLSHIQELVPSSFPLGFIKYPNYIMNEYAFNKNGAMTKDYNTGIANIRHYID